MDGNLGRSVSAKLTFNVTEPATIVLQVRPASSAGRVSAEQLDVALDGAACGTYSTIEENYGGLLHVIHSGVGHLTLGYLTELKAPASVPHRRHARAPVSLSDLR
jgi:hypothetical protein